MNMQHFLEFEQFCILCKESESFRKTIFHLLIKGNATSLEFYKNCVKSNFDRNNLVSAVKWVRSACQNDLKAFSSAGYTVENGVLTLAGAKKFVDDCLS